MGRQRCTSCCALLCVCLVSCRAELDSHDHSGDHSEVALQPSLGGSTDFASWLGAESPEAHVKHMYEESGVLDTVFSWMLDASRYACCPQLTQPVPLIRSCRIRVGQFIRIYDSH